MQRIAVKVTMDRIQLRVARVTLDRIYSVVPETGVDRIIVVMVTADGIVMIVAASCNHLLHCGLKILYLRRICKANIKTCLSDAFAI